MAEMNDDIHASDEINTETVKQKSSKINGFHLFYRETINALMNDSSDQSALNLSEMSKIGSRQWKALDDATRKEWNKRGQQKREEEDCGQTMLLVCPRCKKEFKRHKEFTIHKKNCEECTCSICDKKFMNKIQLKKHSVIHSKTIQCVECSKYFSSIQALKRHTLSTHDKKTYQCLVCKKWFSTEGNMKRHKKIHT